MTKLRHLTSQRASREAIDNFCVMYNVTAERKTEGGKRARYKYWIVRMAEPRYWLFRVGAMHPVSKWVELYDEAIKNPKVELSFHGTKSGRWSSCPTRWTGKSAAMQASLAAMSAQLRRTMIVPPRMLSLENLSRHIPLYAPKSVWIDEMKDIDARVMAALDNKVDLQSHLTDAMAYGTSVVYVGADFADGTSVPAAPRSVRSSGADGLRVPRVRAKFLGIARSPNRSSVRGSHRHDEVRAQMESRDDRGNRKAKRARVMGRWGGVIRYMK